MGQERDTSPEDARHKTQEKRGVRIMDSAGGPGTLEKSTRSRRTGIRERKVEARGGQFRAKLAGLRRVYPEDWNASIQKDDAGQIISFWVC